MKKCKDILVTGRGGRRFMRRRGAHFFLENRLTYVSFLNFTIISHGSSALSWIRQLTCHRLQKIWDQQVNNGKTCKHEQNVNSVTILMCQMYFSFLLLLDFLIHNNLIHFLLHTYFLSFHFISLHYVSGYTVA
jgi:hypothetical protein